jgi:hypothetical protein
MSGGENVIEALYDTLQEERAAREEQDKLNAYYAAIAVHKGRELHFRILDCIPQNVVIDYVEERYGL